MCIRDSPTHFIIISSHTSFEYARKAIQLGAEDFLPKPVSRTELVKTLNLVLEKLKTPEHKEESYRKLIQTAKGYIDLNFDKHLTLDSVASHVYVSSSYLSTLFKNCLLYTSHYCRTLRIGIIYSGAHTGSCLESTISERKSVF